MSKIPGVLPRCGNIPNRAIFEAIWRAFPAERVRIADRGLREGMLTQLMSADRGASQATRMGH